MTLKRQVQILVLFLVGIPFVFLLTENYRTGRNALLAQIHESSRDLARLQATEVELFLRPADQGAEGVGRAVEMPPDLYISHCDYAPATFSGGQEVWQTLRSKDVPGIFLPSFEEELKTYVPPSVTFRFRAFDAVQLTTFWENYRKDTTYNFTNRNCSVTGVAALEAALLGVLRRGGFSAWLDLLFSGDLWLAQFLRNKAGEAVWTPGMVLDYTRALHRLVEDR